MPAYEYENEEHGLRVVVAFPVAARPDVITLKRRTVPTRVFVGVGALPPTTGDKLQQGYKDLEEKGQLRDRGGNYLDVKTIKKAIAMPETD